MSPHARTHARTPSRTKHRRHARRQSCSLRHFDDVPSQGSLLGRTPFLFRNSIKVRAAFFSHTHHEGNERTSCAIAVLARAARRVWRGGRAECSAQSLTGPHACAGRAER